VAHYIKLQQQSHTGCNSIYSTHELYPMMGLFVPGTWAACLAVQNSDHSNTAR
jgi:hypothetical protein